ncbi:MAG: hypothetical protein AAGG51_13205 [Cyanobacteria bacterium P01_G01_bin.54]
MTPTMLRQFWSLVENTQASFILNQDDSSLVNWLIAQMNRHGVENLDDVDAYVRSRTTLIRDIVAAR